MKRLQLITLFVVLGTMNLFAQSNYGKACKLLNLENYVEAIRYYTKVIEEDATFCGAYRNRAVAYWRIKQYEKAIEDYTKAFSLADDYDKNVLYEICNGFGIDYEKSKDYAKAGRVYEKINKYEKAIENYTKAIEEGATTYLYERRGCVYSKINEYEKAIKDYEKAGRVYEKINEYEKAIENYTKAGSVCEKINEYEKAIENYTKAIEEGATTYLYERRGCVYSKINEYEKAIKDYTKAISLTEDEKNKDDLYEQLNILYAITVPKKFIYNYVKDSIVKWQIKGEFEKTSDYKERLTKRDEHIDLLKKEALKEASNMFRNYSVNWDNINISEYDADSESFELTIGDLLKIFIHIPITEAEQFKANVKNIVFSKPEFLLYNNKWLIGKLNLSIPQSNKKYTYNISDQPEYNPKTFITNFADIQIDIPEPDIDIKPEENPEIIKIGVSGIDKNLPKTQTKNNNAFAVIIGNENYTHTKPINFAKKDAQSIKNYLITTLGYSANNIFVVNDAIKSDFELYFGTNGNHKGKLFNNITQGESDVFIYYSGHGAPGLKDRKGYFMPTDCEPNYVQVQGYSQDVFFDNLAMLPAKSTTIVIDACFSGTDVYTDIKGIIIPKPNNTIFKLKNGVLLTSSESTQVSCSYNDQNHSLFTYYFLKAIQDKNGSDTNRDNKLSFEEIYKYVSDNITGVPSVARKLGKEQTPTIRGNKEKILVDYR